MGWIGTIIGIIANIPRIIQLIKDIIELIKSITGDRDVDERASIKAVKIKTKELADKFGIATPADLVRR